MHKIVALSLAVFCGACFVLSTIWGLSACQATFRIVGIIFGAMAYSKYRRDARLAAISRRAELESAKRPQLAPSMSSQGSSRLFVPPSLKQK